MSSNDIKVNLESLLLSYYIKYDKLLELNNEAFANVQSDRIDIYIDIYDMLKPIYTRDVYANKSFVIVSSIINLAAHLRAYYWTRHRMTSRIFLVYGDCSSMSHKQFLPMFGDDEFRGTLNYAKNEEFIKSQLELVKILAAYIYDVYYIPRKCNFSIFTYDNILRNPNIPAVIISKSKYAYQIPALLHNAVLFRPKKVAGADTSYYINYTNTNLRFFSKIASQNTRERLSLISPRLLSVLMCMTGLYSYKVNSLMNTTTAVKLLHNALCSNMLINDYNSDIDYLYKALGDLSKYIDPVTFKCRFNAIDLLYQHNIYRFNDVQANDISWLINLNDPDTVRDINNRYFVDNPLDLNVF